MSKFALAVELHRCSIESDISTQLTVNVKVLHSLMVKIHSK